MLMEAIASFVCHEVSAVPGQTFVCSDALAEMLIDLGYAKEVKEVKEKAKGSKKK